MSSYSSIYYFMIGNINTRQPIGNYINTKINDNNFDNIKFTCDDIFLNSSENLSSTILKNKMQLDYYIIFYTIKNSGTFYLAVVLKNSLYGKEEHLIFELFEDIDHQGIKKLVNKNGVLTHVGEQNLKFCIELFQENNRKNNKNRKDKETFFKNNDMSKISLLNNELNDIQTNMKKTVKNIITNVNDMSDLNDKSSKIKDTSYQFQKDSEEIEKKMRYRKFIRKLIFFNILAIIFIFLIYLFYI